MTASWHEPATEALSNRPCLLLALIRALKMSQPVGMCASSTIGTKTVPKKIHNSVKTRPQQVGPTKSNIHDDNCCIAP